MVGTSVRDSPYEATSASTTFTASGVKIYFAEPESSVTGTKTMQIDMVEISAGIATCSALSRIALTSGFFSPTPRLRCGFSISTVASSTSMPTARASHREQNPQRNGYAHNQRASPTAQKHQHHHRGEKCGGHCFLHHILDRSPHQHRLIEDRRQC